MLRRTVSTALWAYFGWYATAHALSLIGLSTALAPAGGLVVGALALYDWRAQLRRHTTVLSADGLPSQRTS